MSLTDTQLVILSAASQREDHLLTRPATLRGNAAELFRKKLIGTGFAEEVPVGIDAPHWREDEGGGTGLRITATGLAAIGIEAASDAAPWPQAEPVSASALSPRPGSKQAQVLDLLGRDEGATLADLIAATGWLPHTTRAVLTGLRHKGHAITRDSGSDGTSRYRLANR